MTTFAGPNPLHALNPGCSCLCEDSACIICVSGFNNDPYRDCPYTVVSGYWLEEEGKLTGSGPGLMLFDEAPPLPTDPVKVSVNVLSLDPYDGTFWLIAGWVDEDTFVFGELKIEGGVVTMRVGQNGSYLTEPVELGESGFVGSVRVELCWRPPVEQETTEHVLGALLPMGATGGGDPPLVPFSSVDDILSCDGVGASAELLSPAPGDTSGPLGAFWTPFLPTGATIDGIGVNVRVREEGEAYDALGIEDILATLSIGGMPLENQATNAAIPAGEFGDMAYGGPTDLWGASEINVEDIASGGVSFGVQYKVPAEAPDGRSAIVTVDCISLTIWYTTRADVPGRLTMTVAAGQSVGNSCSTAFDVAGVSGKAGLQVVEGDWEFDTFRHAFMASGPHPGCETCDCGFTAHPNPSACTCCGGYVTPGGSIILILGSGWTADTCAGCSDVGGIYLLDAARVSCDWHYQEVIECGPTPCAFSGKASLTITAGILPLEAVCKWRAVVQLTASTVADPSDPTDSWCLAQAIYESEPIAGDCQDFPVTLTKVSEVTGLLCNGELPETITLDLP